MTEKKEKILHTALQLFASNGYNATSTAQIAKLAEVSEGLIFRHFSSKKGLLDYIYEEMEQKTAQILAPILATKDPKETIRLSIDFPFTHLVGENYHYWRLLFRLKWQEGYDASENMHPLRERLHKAFEELGYDHPALETQLLERTVDGIATTVMLTNIEDQLPLRAFLFKKYNLITD